MKHPDHIIPENIKGVQTDTISTESFDTSEEARIHFQTVRKRLLTISNWHEFAGTGTAKFRLTDSSGNTKTNAVEEGDFFKIDIPAPGTESGEGYDWVQVEKIEEDSHPTEDWEYTLIRVRPASDPRVKDDSTAHFFSDDANSYFLAKRIGTEVSAAVHGRNEQPNTDTNSTLDKIRNVIVAIGAMLGMSKVQWKSLVDGLVKFEIKTDH